MKNYIILILSLLISLPTAWSQSVPQGMKYQAVARDEKGQVIADKSLQLKISLYSDSDQKGLFTETHSVTTNSLGLFSLTIGEGVAQDGQFAKVPWSTQDIWMEVAIMADDDTDFVTISNSRMLSVPYAFHAATAGDLINEGSDRSGIPSSVWTLKGNSSTDPARDKLGTTDYKDLIVVTMDVERMRVLADGDINVTNSMTIGKDLEVMRNTLLNTEGGETINYGDFTVEDGSQTLLTGPLTVLGHTQLKNTLTVEEHTELKSTLTVDDAAQFNNHITVNGHGYFNRTLNVEGETNLHDALNVDGASTLGSTLDVAGKVHFTDETQSTHEGNGALVVEGGVGIGKNLNVGGNVSFNGPVFMTDDLNIEGYLSVKSSSQEFVARIENTNGSQGDGIEIKLGKTHPAWDGGAYLNVTNPGTEVFDNAISKVEGWIDGETFVPTDILYMNANGYIPGTTCKIINLITAEMNSGLDLPVNLPDIPVTPPIPLFGGWNFPGTDNPPLEIPSITVPALTIPGFTLIPEIDSISCGPLPAFTIPNISVTDVDNSLDNENQFLAFVDKDGRELGSVRAESVSDWRRRFFDGQYFIDLMGEVIGLDVLSGVAGAFNKFTEIATDHNAMGVEYASGHGDYAEWLERIDHAEIISSGDIVGVRAGKITKDLTNAEQVMAVSSIPIVLGNIPTPQMEPNGNKIAFMGQIPVKIIGPVAAGDYIVGNESTPGYGIAVHPSGMTVEYAKHIVGRAWDSNEKDGPKMINTVIGVDNGHFLTIIGKYKKSLDDMDARLTQVEAMITGHASVSKSSKRNHRK